MTAVRRVPWEWVVVGLLAAYPVVPGLPAVADGVLLLNLGTQLTILFVMAVLALGLNVVVGYTGLLQLGIAAFFAVGAYTAGVLTVDTYPFGFGLLEATAAATLTAAFVGLLLGAPTLRLRGDYLALVTVGFGEVMQYALLNLREITNGASTLNPIPTKLPPRVERYGTDWFGMSWNWAGDYRYFYYLCLAALLLVLLGLRNLERSRLGRAWVAIREDELAAACMGLNVGRLKLGAFALGAAVAGLPGALYAAKLTTTSDPASYGFNRSVIVLCCLILGGLGNRPGVLLGVFLVIGFDNIFAPAADSYLQKAQAQDWFPAWAKGKEFLTFKFWKLAAFGLALVLVMRFRPEGLLPSDRMKMELHPETEDKATGRG